MLGMGQAWVLAWVGESQPTPKPATHPGYPNLCFSLVASQLYSSTPDLCTTLWSQTHTYHSVKCDPCQDWFFTDLISMRGLGVRGRPSGKTKMLRSVVALPEY